MDNQSRMNFTIALADSSQPTDAQLTDLLHSVYVSGGFTDPKTAQSIFNATAVRTRGALLAAHCKDTSAFAGMVIVVPAASKACRFAEHNECEMHLLAVKPDYRRAGLGAMLIAAALDYASRHGYRKMLLWTQTGMNTAQRAYERTGFRRIQRRDFVANGRNFLFYEQELTR